MIGGTATWSTGHVNEIEKYVRENARDGIDLVTGVVENNKVPFYINQAKIALVVSKMEAQGLNSLEPMSCGVPAIGRNVGGVSESIQDFPELLIPFDAPAEVYIEKIKKYLNDGDLRLRVRKSVEDKFSIYKTYEKLETYYKKIYEDTKWKQ